MPDLMIFGLMSPWLFWLQSALLLLGLYFFCFSAMLIAGTKPKRPALFIKKLWTSAWTAMICNWRNTDQDLVLSKKLEIVYDRHKRQTEQARARLVLYVVIWLSGAIPGAIGGIGYMGWHSKFQARPQVYWKVIAEYPVGSRIGYDIEQSGGDITPNVIPCNDRGLHTGMVITSVGFTDRGHCLDFGYPGWMKIEYPTFAMKGTEQ